MNKIKNLLIATILTLASFGANATLVTNLYDNTTYIASVNGNYSWYGPYLYGGYVIGICDSYLSDCILSPVSSSLPSYVNNDIYAAYNYAIAHGIRITWGRCTSNGSHPPCLQ